MTTFAIDSILVEDRMRSTGDVADLADSIAHLGLLNPITVVKQRQNLGGLDSYDGLVLVAGARRLAACKSLGWSEIEANVVELYDLDLQLAQIDENLIRQELTQLERSEQLERRQWIYEQKHPETKRGVAGGKARQGLATDKMSFAENTAEATSYEPRSVRRQVAIARNIPASLREELKATPQADSQSDLRALAKYKDRPDIQRKAVRAVVEGKAESLRDALPKDEPRKSEKDQAIDDLADYLCQLGADPDRLRALFKPLRHDNPVCGKILYRMAALERAA